MSDNIEGPPNIEVKLEPAYEASDYVAEHEPTYMKVEPTVSDMSYNEDLPGTSSLEETTFETVAVYMKEEPHSFVENDAHICDVIVKEENIDICYTDPSAYENENCSDTKIKNNTAVSDIATNSLAEGKTDSSGLYFERVEISEKNSTPNDKEQPHKCEVCGKSFSQSNKLKAHLLLHSDKDHLECTECEYGSTYVKTEPIVNDMSYNEDLPGTCSLEEKQLETIAIYVKEEPHSYVENDSHIYLPEVKEENCDDADNKDSSTYYDNKHCSDCKKTGESSVMVNNEHCEHKLRSNAKDKKIKRAIKQSHYCSECGKIFSSSKSLKVHLFKHSGTKPYECTECGKCFTLSFSLKRHLLMHRGINPFVCDQCGKSFSQSHTLKNHLVIHSGKKPHECDECGKCFNNPRNLRTHALIHTGIKNHKCTECDKYFLHSSSLKRHLLLHSGINPLKCALCSTPFAQTESLKKHLLLHRDARPYKCTECGKVLSRSQSLKRHLLMHSRLNHQK